MHFTSRDDYNPFIGNKPMMGPDCCEARFKVSRNDLNKGYKSTSGVAFEKRKGKNLDFSYP